MSKIPFHSHEVAVLETLGAAGDGVWDDLRFPATAINPPGQASDPDVEASSGLLLFDSNGTELIYAFVQMPHAWKEGSSISPHVHWQKTTSAAGDVLWRMRYKMAPIGEVMDADWSTRKTILDCSVPVRPIVSYWIGWRETLSLMAGISNVFVEISFCPPVTARTQVPQRKRCSRIPRIGYWLADQPIVIRRNRFGIWSWPRPA